ncbi:MAG: hypothetical protein HY553_09350 [Elusimicrobia bacterium]|nr:hypothetical protein [Elusimicrobiota bacterium]
MAETSRFRLRLKLPSGAELEAEGSPEFVEGERRAFLEEAKPRVPGAAGEPGYRAPDWDALLDHKAGRLQLRAKPHGKSEKEACLILLAGAAALLGEPKPTAAQLAKWLRASGYPIGRIDRALADALTKGELLASGSRRARRYELTGTGRAKAFLLAAELAKTIGS